MTQTPSLLTTRTLPTHLGAVRSPAPNPGILHLGLGNFHRAHQAVYTAAAMDSHGGDWGIIGVANRSRAIVDAMNAQEMLYTVMEISPSGTEFSVPAIHSEVLVGAEDPGLVVDRIASPSIKIVTITVTEHGYHLDPNTGRLNRSADILHDLSETSKPRTILGQLVRGLQARMTIDAPITVLSCDNLASNGVRLKDVVLEFAESTSQGIRLAQWIDECVSFPSSMVDRIVPATQDSHRSAITSSLGYRDQVPVPTEPFSMWAIEDDFRAGRPAWEHHGAIFTSEVDRYEEMKLRLLNGTHSLLAYSGALLGRQTIPDSVRDDQVKTAAANILRNEYLPSVRLPSGLDIDAYEAALFSRWSNTSLGHRTSQVGSDGSVKLPERVVVPALQFLERGEMPHLLALTIAAYSSCIAPIAGFDPGESATQMSDPARPLLNTLAASATSGQQMASALFKQGGVFPPSLGAQTDFVTRVGDFIDVIRLDGIDSALKLANECPAPNKVLPATSPSSAEMERS